MLQSSDSVDSVAPTSTLVGRTHERDVLQRALHESLAGVGQLVLLTGEPGVGKTRLVEYLAGDAAAEGCAVHWGRCWEGEGAPAYWPWVQVLRSCVQAGWADTEDGSRRWAAAEVARLVPEIRDLVRDMPERQVLAPGQARFRLFDAVTEFLKQAAGTTPQALLFDDLHAADPDSLALLTFVTRQLRDMPLLIVAAYRDAEVRASASLSRAIGEVAREGIHLALQGLSESELAQFVDSILRREERGAPPVSSAVIAAIHQATEGTPLFVDHIVRLWAAEGRFDRADLAVDAFRVPDQVRETIRRRLRFLSEPARHVMGVAAVIGREFESLVLQRVLPADYAAGLPAVLDDALAHGALHSATERGRFRFAHALIRDTLYQDLPAGRRAGLHRQIGAAMEALHGDDIEPHLADVAQHFFEAAVDGNALPAIDYASRAAERASALRAYEEAVKHRERALTAFDLRRTDGSAGGDEAQRRCELLIGLGEALNDARERTAARQRFREAAALAREVGAAEQLARAALGYGGGVEGLVEVATLENPTDTFDDSLAKLLDEALGILGDSDSILRARLLGRLAVELYFAAPVERRDSLSREAVAVARRMADDTTLAHVLCDRHVAVWGRRWSWRVAWLGRQLARPRTLNGLASM